MSRATLPCVLDDTAALAEILREHGALAGNQSFALANALVATGAIDLAAIAGPAGVVGIARLGAKRRGRSSPRPSSWPADRRRCICGFWWAARWRRRTPTCCAARASASGECRSRRHWAGNWRERDHRAGAPARAATAAAGGAAGSRRATRSRRTAIRRQCHPQAARGSRRTDGGDQCPSLPGRRQWRRSAAVAVIAFRSARGGGLSLPALSDRDRRRSGGHADGLPGANAASRTCAWFRACMATGIRRPG